ncbi:hypothetical protein ABZY02_34285 [Streptomyces sp. NPDC006649]|uniref:hypothetical protein n=1 Tax=Streptomyces sp. NPDC006649 TaxID=3156896 RepID=UPI0033A41368
MIARPLKAVTGTCPTCPTCKGSFETCNCTGGYAGRVGIADDIRREDDNKGYERDETDQLHQLVDRLATVGDIRAREAGRRARRTLAEMAPGHTRQPILRLTRPLPMRGADDACPLCGRWSCTGNCYAPAPTSVASTAVVA